MNLIQDELVALEVMELTAVVQTMFDDVPVQVEAWQAKPLHGGTVGLVYEISGTCRRMCKAASTEDTGESGRSSPETVSDEEAELRWSVVLKIQKSFARFGDPESWQREMRLYRSDVYAALPPTVKVPRCYRVNVKRGAIWMWLEHVSGRNGTQLSLDEYSQAARHLAHLQGAFLMGKPLPSQPWLSTQYWLAHISADWGTRAIAWLDSGEWRRGTGCSTPITHSPARCATAILAQATSLLWHNMCTMRRMCSAWGKRSSLTGTVRASALRGKILPIWLLKRSYFTNSSRPKRLNCRKPSCQAMSKGCGKRAGTETNSWSGWGTRSA